MTDSSSSSSSGVKVECGCCCFEFLMENMAQCAKGHRFCFGCLRRQVEEIIYGNFKAPASLPCMDTHDCTESIPVSEIRRALPEDVIERYEECQAQEAILQAKLENLVYCPFCNIPCDVDKCVEIFECPNPKCLKASCIQCKKPSHIPLRCEEIEKTSETGPRRIVEERMTKAVVRECKTCKAEMVKLDGCNRLTCSRCRTTMCYVCREILSSGYDHFCDHYYSRKPCPICNKKCSLWETEVEDNVALDAREEALKEFADNEPSLLDQNIGPPLVKKTVQPPSNSNAGRMRLAQVEIVNVEILDQNAANRDLQVQGGNEEQEGGDPYFHNILQQLVEQQLANMDLPPPPEHDQLQIEQYIQRLQQLVGDQLANMAIPAPLIPPPINDQLANMAIPQPDDELAINMQLQANAGNDGAQEQEHSTTEDDETKKEGN